MNKLFNKYAVLTLGFLAVLIFSSNISAQIKTEILIVADQKISCTGVTKMECLQVKRLSEEKYSLFYDNIERFNFVAGFFYVLEVQVTTVRNPAADASKFKYRLRKVLARVKVEENAAQNQPNFFGTEWKLTKIEGQVVKNMKSFIRFDNQKNSAGGNGGCNAFGGNMTKAGNKIKISQIISTKMFCEDLQEVENKFFANLDRVTEYEIKDEKLFLMANKTVILEFEVKK